jgi:transposase-like protein
MRDRAVRMVFEAEVGSGSQWEAIVSASSKLGMTSETLGRWVRQVEIDEARRGGVTSHERECLKGLERENRELRRANEILKAASAVFAAELDGPRRQSCLLTRIGSVSGSSRSAGRCSPSRQRTISETATNVCPQGPRCPAQRRDHSRVQQQLRGQWAPKAWAQLNREGIPVARCTVERPMRDLGIQGAVRGKTKRTTTAADDTVARPAQGRCPVSGLRRAEWP